MSDYRDSALKDFTKFYFKTGRLDYQGKATDDLSFRVRLAFNKDATTGVDSTQTAVEYAFLTHKMSDMFSLSVGKVNSDIGGFEGATSGADLYLTSQFYTLKGPNGDLATRAATAAGTGHNIGTTDLLYMTGVKGTFTFADQNITLLATDEATPVRASGVAAEQNSSLMGAIWRGAFMDKAFMTNLSYHTMNGPADGDKHQLMAAGVMWNANPWMFSADYLMSEFKEDASGDKDTVTSIVAKFAYSGWEKWTPRLEFQTSEEKIEIGGTATNKFIGYGAVLEYKPYTDTNFRYHLAYNNVKEEPETGDDITSQEIVLGARLMADFLK
ncbi:OprO/OprP family phosphate-selective porin [Bdellovibrio bacteriovorus]|uniref:OprO/OprP family phosphate-selective porin n=1 Tax=Bdellovibrio bacteriovorus TaxID=959 RepID=UPI0021D17EE9|nr:OprO/OprP family phosphate-selective porin [Bdellovibrio bacteriovorus]UXR65312.1 OprO/OprP family phosphate-selective porin [Bdellovibrio bacteriovorus]